MRPVTLLFAHGWGFDAGLWDALRAALAEWPSLAIDRGYFGAPLETPPDGPVVAIGHSLGALRLLLAPPPGLRALVAINGFDRFAGGAGVAPRVIGRMATRFGEAPRAVLAGFRARCGDATPFGPFDAERLGADLAMLRDADGRDARFPLPLLALDGGADPILPAALRSASFGHAARLRRVTYEGGGHLLPATATEWCAAHIRPLLAQVA